MKETENILQILQETKEAMMKKDTYKLNYLSNRTIHMASIYKDTDNILIAIISYVLSKLMQKEEVKKFRESDELYEKSLLNIEKAKNALERGDIKEFRKNLEEIRKSVNKLSPNLKEFVQDVFRKAQINKASKIYEHGISLGETAQVLGITPWELASYAGQKSHKETREEKTFDIKSRIKTAKKFFT